VAKNAAKISIVENILAKRYAIPKTASHVKRKCSRPAIAVNFKKKNTVGLEN
jgi:hypothetical protein